VVCAVTIICFVLEQVFALVLPEHVTHFQERAFNALDWGYKIGFGAFLGLLGGKVS
jgi:hypothetical protein